MAPRSPQTTPGRALPLASTRALGVLVCLAVAGAAGWAGDKKPPPDALADPRFGAAFTLPGTGPLLPVALLAEVRQRAGVGLVASGADMRRPLARRDRAFTAREALGTLATHLEGTWRWSGEDQDTLVLGPPAGFERIVGQHPAQLRGYMDQQWGLLLRSLTRADRERLGRGEAVPAGDLSPTPRAAAHEIARAVYWRQRRDRQRSVALVAAAEGRCRVRRLEDGRHYLDVDRIALQSSVYFDRFPERD
jgi:hypothetical protein